MSVPDEHEALDGTVTDQRELDKIWSRIGVDGVAGSHRSLEGNTRPSEAATPRRRPILVTVADKNQRSHSREDKTTEGCR